VYLYEVQVGGDAPLAQHADPLDLCHQEKFVQQIMILECEHSFVFSVDDLLRDTYAEHN
jgi:hypothetical protein